MGLIRCTYVATDALCCNNMMKSVFTAFRLYLTQLLIYVYTIKGNLLMGETIDELALFKYLTGKIMADGI